MRAIALLAIGAACGAPHAAPPPQTPPSPQVGAEPRPLAVPAPATGLGGELRSGALATVTAMTAGAARKVDKCVIEPRTASDPHVQLQLVARCAQARALAMATGGGVTMATMFSQQGLEPALVIGAGGEVELKPQSAIVTVLRYDGGAFKAGVELPPNAPPLPATTTVLGTDGAAILAKASDELVRGTIETTGGQRAWKFERAFKDRVPADGALWWPVVLPHPKGEPTIVYVTDPREHVDLTARLPGGKTITIPPWGPPKRGDYRISRIAAIEIDGEALPVIAAKIDDGIVLAYPHGETYDVKTLAGATTFPELPPPATDAAPKPGPGGPRCSEASVSRDREEVYAPQLFAWNGAVLAFLSSRVHERAHWTFAPVAGKTPAEDRIGCDWVVEQRTAANELVVMRLDAKGGHEVLRVPVEYAPGNGFHGAELLVARAADTLHTIATSYGTITYTRLRLP